MDGFGWRETSAESRRTRSISSSLARRLQNSEDEVARLARLNDKKDSAIRVLLVMKSVMLRKLGAQKAAGCLTLLLACIPLRTLPDLGGKGHPVVTVPLWIVARPLRTLRPDTTGISLERHPHRQRFGGTSSAGSPMRRMAPRATAAAAWWANSASTWCGIRRSYRRFSRTRLSLTTRWNGMWRWCRTSLRTCSQSRPTSSTTETFRSKFNEMRPFRTRSRRTTLTWISTLTPAGAA